MSIILLFFSTDASSPWQSTYSSDLTTNSHSYSRDNCQLPRYFYEAIQIDVNQGGCYSFASNSDIDTHIYMYRNIFSPLDPSMNLILRESSVDKQSQLMTSLHGRSGYVLVVTTSSPDITGRFSIDMLGPANISVQYISE